MVSKLAKAVALLMLVFWGLATVHCGFERLPGFEFLACCDHVDRSPHQDDDCGQDSCAVVESGHYRFDSQPASLPVPSFVLELSFALWEAPIIVDSPILQAPYPGSTHLHLVRTWQFSHRTALPPRAPSCAS